MISFVITQELIDCFLRKFQEDESQYIKTQYKKDLMILKQVAQENEDIVNQDVLDQWKQELINRGYAKGTITNKVVHVNRFLREIGYGQLCFKKGGKKDLTGQQFGNLTVLKEATKKSPDRSVLWICRCNLCGKEKEIPANQLIRGVQTSCGCAKSTRLQKTNGYIDGTSLKNVFSEKISKNNTSGYKGVYKKRDKWAAKIQYKKKNYYLGSYERLEDAVNARKEAEKLIKEDAKKLLDKLNKQRK